MKISLIHPTRGRQSKSATTVKRWIDKSINQSNLEVIVSLDYHDAGPHYEQSYIGAGIDEKFVSFMWNDNTCVVEAANKAAKVATGDIMIYLSDDFDCPEGWDYLIRKQFVGEDRPLLLKVEDGLQKFDVPVLTIPIMNRALYNTLGYFWHPAYKSMFVDEDLYWTVRKLGALKNAPWLVFEHQHVSVGKAENDDTYKRSSSNWDQGKATFARRKAAGFPL